MRKIFTEKAPAPGGHYVQAWVHNDMVYVSGQLPIDPLTGEKITYSIEAQTRRVLENVAAVVEAAGSDIRHIIKTTVYVADIGLWAKVDGVYADFFGDHKPARAVVPTRELHYGFQVEIEAVAVLPDVLPA